MGMVEYFNKRLIEILILYSSQKKNIHIYIA